MPRNNNTLSEKTKITLGLVLAILIGLSGFGTVAYKSAAAMSREQAYRTFWTQKQQEIYSADAVADRKRIETKLDRIIGLMIEDKGGR